MAYTEPLVADFKAYFVRDFPYGTDVTMVMDQDIANALIDAHVSINQDLWSSQQEFTNAFLNLAAHFMVSNLRASSQGIGGQYAWLEASKSVGSVSESFSLPPRIAENPQMSMFAKTNYGAKYLMMILPYLTGASFIAPGITQP